jgi:hypothetical protein
MCLSLSHCLSHRARRESSLKYTDCGWGGVSCTGGGLRQDISRSSPGTLKRRPPITHRRVASVAWTPVSCCILFGVKRKLKKKIMYEKQNHASRFFSREFSGICTDTPPRTHDLVYSFMFLPFLFLIPLLFIFLPFWGGYALACTSSSESTRFYRGVTSASTVPYSVAVAAAS